MAPDSRSFGVAVTPRFFWSCCAISVAMTGGFGL
jgi:hypothetical protein